MVFNRINILKILLIFVLMIVFLVLVIKNTNQIETNLVKSILPEDVIENTKIIQIMEKPSRLIKVVFEANDEDKLYILKQNFVGALDTTVFITEDTDFSKIVDIYSKSPTNFLSQETKKLLQKDNFEAVYQKSLERLYNPVGIQIADFARDPFLLLTDFLTSNDISSKNKYFDNKFYDTAIIKIRPEVKEVQKEISNIMSLKKHYSDNNQQVYLAGVPIHTYCTTLASSITINLVSFFITALIIFLTYLFFRNYFLLLPIALSILFGYLAAFSVTNTIYDNFHLITLLFGTTLIGIGIDYSYHYIFSMNRDFKFYKNLTLSFLSTTIAFSLLYVLKIEILSQIATFTNIGLLAIFVFILLVYPCINFSEPIKFYSPKLNIKYKKSLLILIIIFSIAGFFKINFNDSLSSLYKPGNALVEAEKLFNKVSNQPETSGVVIPVSGSSEKNLTEAVEEVTSVLDTFGIEYISISKFLPSRKVQKENYELVNRLYKNKLVNYSNLLSSEQIEKLEKEAFVYQEFGNINSLFEDLLLDNSTALVILTSDFDISKLKDKNINAVNFQATVSNQLEGYRIKLLKILPFIYLLLYLLLIVFYGVKSGTRMILPIVISAFMVISMMSLVGIDLNLFNILGLLLALGFTIDYAIFNKNNTKETETAIFLACVTTAFSFILLSFTAFKLIGTLAFTLSLSIIFNYILIKIFTKEEV